MMTTQERADLYGRLLAYLTKDEVEYYEDDEGGCSWTFKSKSGPSIMTGDGGARLVWDQLRAGLVWNSPPLPQFILELQHALYGQKKDRNN